MVIDSCKGNIHYFIPKGESKTFLSSVYDKVGHISSFFSILSYFYEIIISIYIKLN